MVENLQALCANVDDDFGWTLRKTLQTEPQIILVATATSRFEGLDDAREPFFELFRIISLVPLDAAQCGLLWKVVSSHAASGRQQRALQILTGGSPRYLVIVAGFARHRSMRRLMEELVQLIDDLTDTFRGYLEALPKTERRVFLAMADLWQSSSTGEIAARSRLDVRTVSTMLGRLVERRAVNCDGSGRKRLYEVADPLLCIYYQLRRQRDEAAVVQNLLRFMTVFYTDAEIPKLFGSLKLEALESPAILAGVERAQSELPTLKWKARYVRMSAALSLGNRAGAVDAFCSLYAAFVPENETMIPELVEAVAMLVVGGVPEREIIGALRSDPQKAAHVAPLVIALRQRSGEVVRAPAEMLEVAADVRKRIEETEPLPASTTRERHPVEA